MLAIASPNRERLVTESERLNIPKIYDTYEELLLDPVIDAVYIPLPNHLHVQWSLKAMEADKHVLCEKPIGMSAAEALELLEASKQKPHLKVMEVFIHRFHPQWIYAKKLVDDGKIGEIKTVQSFFSYYNTDPANIRNRKEVGGGGLMDIGCYCISFARYIFGQEPAKVFGSVEFDPTTNVDRVASGILDFGKGTSTFTCSTQMMPYQRVNIIGTEARIEIEIPVRIKLGRRARPVHDLEADALVLAWKYFFFVPDLRR